MFKDTAKHDPMYFWERLEYPIRVAWYNTKLKLGIEPISDKNFLPHDFAMRIKRNILPAKTKFTIAGRSDGVGMQAMARISGIHFAHIYGATYVDKPFSIVDHVTGRDVTPLSEWEKLLNLGRDELALREDEDNVIDYADYIAGRKTWHKDSVLRLQQCFWLYRRHPELLDYSTPIFQNKYDWSRSKKNLTGTISVAVHVRRGDVGERRNSKRFTSNQKILYAIAQVEQVLTELNQPYHITIHSQGIPSEFIEFTSRGYDLNLVDDAIIAMRHFIESDIFVMSKSSFSYLAAIYNRGIKLYEPTFNPCLPSWLARTTNGDIDKRRLKSEIQLRLQYRPQD